MSLTKLLLTICASRRILSVMKPTRLAPLLVLALSSCATLGGRSNSELVYVVEASGGA